MRVTWTTFDTMIHPTITAITKPTRRTIVFGLGPWEPALIVPGGYFPLKAVMLSSPNEMNRRRDYHQHSQNHRHSNEKRPVVGKVHAIKCFDQNPIGQQQNDQG